MLRIVHLSDLHLTDNDGAETNKNAWTIARRLFEAYAHPPAETIVIVTGDCIDNGTEAERQRLIDWLAYLRQFFFVLIVPGNHDYATFGNVFVPDSVEPFRKIARVDRFPYVHQVFGYPVTIMLLDSADPEDKEWFAEGVIGSLQLEALDRSLHATVKGGRIAIVCLHHHPFCRDLGMAIAKALPAKEYETRLCREKV